MDYYNYVNGISFRFMGPHTYFKGFRLISKLFGKLNISLEVLNTKLPENEKEMKKNLYEILNFPRMSTFAIGAMINKAVAGINDDCSFVNVGVWNGFSLLAGMKGNIKKKCIGIDNFSQFGGPREQFIQRFDTYKGANHYFYDIDYREYFSAHHNSKIGFYIYDGDHSYENQLIGLRAAEPFFSRNCLILVDDTNDKEPKQATLDFIQSSNAEYRILLDKTTLFNMHPTLWNGVMIFQRID